MQPQMEANLKEIQDIKITVEAHREKATFEFPSDSSIEDYKYLFYAILSFVTFDLDSIKELFSEEDETKED